MGDSPEGGTPARRDDDRAEVERAARGDLDAFGVLVGRYQHRVVHFARSLAGHAEAEDIAQEAFLRAYHGLAGFRGASTFKTWLYRIVVNTARTHRARRPAEAGSPAGGGDPAPLIDRAAAPGDLERAVIDRDRIDRALGALPPELREAVVLRDVEGLDYREIAAALGVPLGTVESRIFRGRARLRQVLLDPAPAGKGLR